MTPIQLPVAELKPALTGLAKVISRRTTLPVLGHIRLERTSAGHIELAGTDLDTTAVARLTTKQEAEPHVLLIPYEVLQNLSRGCGKEDSLQVSKSGENKLCIRFPVAGNWIEHQCETLPAEEFPPRPGIEGNGVVLDQGLRDSIQQGLQCASSDETRAILNGVYLDVSKPEGHHVIATDGRHLFSSNSFTLPLPSSVLLPSSRFLTWKPFLEDGDWELKVGVRPKDGPQYLQLESPHWRLITRCQEGTFPNWRHVIPDRRNFATKLEIDPAVLDDVLKAIAQVPDHDPTNHTIGLESAGSVRLLARSGDDWKAIPLPGIKTTGKDIRIFLNRKYLVKALRFGLTTIELIDPLSPLRFSAGGRQMIIMPIRPDSASASSRSPTPAQTTTPPPVEQAANNERTTMPNENKTETKPTVSDKPALETALAQIEKARATCRETISGLNDLTALLRQAQREHRNSDKEIASVRQTLRSLQSVKL